MLLHFVPSTDRNLHQFREYLEANGYDTSAMGIPGSETTSVAETASVDEKKINEREV